MTETREFKPKLPRLEDIDGAQIRLDYDTLSDSLWVSFVGGARPAVNVYAETDDDLMYLVDPITEEVVGLEVENFLGRALRLSPYPGEVDGQ